ncbi:MAG: FAD-dependent oxidoreductase [Defluviitaleaceae bacterium]|nr:FAD-dependent oxidoreductase [Defluviitaleaceae bacterium]MCL2262081.1 FAD-dependent oxidoreductase [Defluviitaleaceae bacterium]
MKIKIDGTECTAIAGQTILAAAKENGIFIPSLCFGEGLAPTGACGICVVEADGNGRLVRACATAVRDGMEVLTSTPQILAARKNLLELTLSAHTGDCIAPCKIACPAQSDCQGFISLIAAGKFPDAVELMKDAHPFPASVARICPRPCETKCRRAIADEPVNIAALKRFAADIELDNPNKYIPQVAPATGKAVAVVGGGPAGLTAAFFLRKAGHNTSVFEAMPKMGGLLRYGIPEYRLPKLVLDEEIEILPKMGIHFFNNMGLGRDITMQFLQTRYDAVIIATGAGVSKPIWCEGEDAQGVLGGIDFLKAVAENNPPQIGKRVVVIGGSNTAMDAARTAIRLGAEAIVSYRRTRDEMPAEKIEVEEALAEGVQFNFLTAPLEITSENGRATGIKLQKMTLGEPDESGRRRPVPVEGGEEFIPADTIIAAIGQDVTMEGLNPLENLSVDPTFRTNLPNVFAIGDATGKSSYAIDAIGHGRAVAEVVNLSLAGASPSQATFGVKGLAPCGGGGGNAPTVLPPISEQLPPVLVCDEKTAEDFAEMPKSPRQNPAAHTMYEGDRPDFSAVQLGFTPQEAAEEAQRCLSCGCADYFECKLIPLANMYGADANKFPKEFHKKPKHKIDISNFNFRRDMNKCVLCGLCVSVCNSVNEKSGGKAGEVLSATNRGFDTTIAAAFGQPLQNRDECALCGNCVARCPVGALTENSPLPKQLVIREDMTHSTCTMCGNGCAVTLASKAGQILRLLPAEGKTLCEKGRFGFLQLGEKLFTPLVKKDGLLRRATLQEAAKAIHEGINVLKAQYGAESVGISVSPRYTTEDLDAIKKYAAYIGTPHIFTLTNTSDEQKTHCNTQALKKLGISTENETYLQMLKDVKIKGLISFGDELPAALAETALEFLTIQAAYTSALATKVAHFAHVILPAPALGEISGTILNAKTGKTLQINPTFPPACGYQTRQLINTLME